MRAFKILNLAYLLSISVSVLYLQGCAVAAVSGAATGVTMAQDRRTTGTILDDKGIELKAIHAFTENKPLWKASHLSAISYNNSVLLVGQTPTEAYRNEAEAAILNIPKVRKVYNELEIGAPISFSERSKDSWITTQIKAKMCGKKGLNPTRVKVTTEHGIVYLMGLTTMEEELLATEIARTVSGVEKVVQIFERT